MTNRITEKDLFEMVDHLNKERGNTGPVIVDGDWQVGHYTLGFAYGGVQLQEIVSRGGAVRTPLHNGYLSKRELYRLMIGFH